MADMAMLDLVSMTSTDGLRRTMKECSEYVVTLFDPHDLAVACYRELASRGVATFEDFEIMTKVKVAFP